MNVLEASEKIKENYDKRLKRFYNQEVQKVPEGIRRNYQGMIVGDLFIPYVSIIKNKRGYSQKDVTIDLKEEEFILPEGLREFYEETVEIKSKSRYFNNGPATRLNSVKRKEGRLEMEVQPTNWFSHVCSNKSVDKKTHSGIIRRKYVNERRLKRMEDKLANPIGVDLGLVTSDGYILVTQRSKNLGQYPGLYGIPAGFLTPFKDGGNPFNAALREFSEEIIGKADGTKKYKSAMKKIMKNLKLIGIGRAYDDLHVEVLMTAKTNVTAKYLIEKNKFAEDKWEFDDSTGSPIIAVPFTPKGAAKYLARTIDKKPEGTPDIKNIWIEGKSPAWVPAQWVVVYEMVSKKFGKERVNRAIKKELLNK